MKKSEEHSRSTPTSAKTPTWEATSIRNENSTPPAAPNHAPQSVSEKLTPDPMLKDLHAFRELRPAGVFQILLTRAHLQVYALFNQIEAAYGARPYVAGTKPEAPPSRHRAQAYMADLRRAIELANLDAQLQEIAHRMQIAPTTQAEPKTTEEKLLQNRKSVSTGSTRREKKKL